ncbi:imidazole glycerol phosphate synthase subunit HisH [Flavihumibacter fluvii]|uniref:imidazole glycerol phosphate synthase subunit HisH n=1 Tax=Flavihumibacter fluvii TaxID=2838157 RepID=UPI001BDEE632|nr:imidazole glycerol phosphate synthase subunit HisH [Flavihumibacter fluvii]ULQ53598.1 imidazole glycerol phosphate synthase subunit HisH [Flavihumibacter fluvii]
MDLAIVKYNAGNIQSVLYALERIGATATVTDDHAILQNADKVIFPGVGEASSAMRYLREKGLDVILKNLQQPVLGICLGMQLMCTWSEENDTTCLGIFDEPVKQFRPTNRNLKVPQIGWNTISSLQSPLFDKIPEDSYCYFVHGYYAALGNQTIAVTDYVQPYSSALQHKNFYGVQFHPEKSAKVGEQILRNFLAI